MIMSQRKISTNMLTKHNKLFENIINLLLLFFDIKIPFIQQNVLKDTLIEGLQRLPFNSHHATN